jgi:GT2 family glycosyltransferase
VVVDNGSTDRTPELLDGRAGVRVVRFDANRGFAVAANAGARATEAELVAFLNNDVEVESGWLAELVSALDRHPNAAVVAPKLVRADDPGVLDNAGDAMTWSLKAYRRGAGEHVTSHDTEEEVFSAPATACVWRRDAFWALDGFDERFFAYYEDVDLGFRAQAAGLEAWYVPSARARHVGGATSASAPALFDSYHAVANRWATILVNAPRPWLVRRAHVVLAGEALSLGRAVAEGRLRTQLRAYGTVLRARSTWLAARRERQAARVVPAAALGRLVTRSFPPRRGRPRR